MVKETFKALVWAIQAYLYSKIYRLTGWEYFWTKGYIALNKAGKFFK